MNLTFDDASHTYTLDGAQTPSVTRMLEDEGLYDNPYANDSHRARGSAVHRMCELIDGRPWEAQTAEQLVAISRWDPTTTHYSLVPYGWAWARFCVDNQFHAELREEPVASAIYGLAGTLDRWGKANGGKLWLVDIKSGAPGPSARIQTALYALMLAEMKDLRTDVRKAVWLKNDGTYRATDGEPEDTAVGLAAVKLWKWRRKNGLFT